MYLVDHKNKTYFTLKISCHTVATEGIQKCTESEISKTLHVAIPNLLWNACKIVIIHIHYYYSVFYSIVYFIVGKGYRCKYNVILRHLIMLLQALSLLLYIGSFSKK